MGRPNVSKPVDGRSSSCSSSSWPSTNVWSKVSCPERLSVTGPGARRRAQCLSRLLPFASRMVETFPGRVLWGTDGRTRTSRTTCPTRGCWWTSSRHIAAHAWELQTAIAGRQSDAACTWAARTEATWQIERDARMRQTLSTRRHDDLRRGAVAQGLLAEPVLHVADEGRQPRTLQGGERAYLDEWPMTEEQKQAVLARDLNRCIAAGGNIYFLAKIGATDGKSFQQMAGSMTGMSEDEYRKMMIRGGRSVDGNRVSEKTVMPRRIANARQRPGAVGNNRNGRAVLRWPVSALRSTPPTCRPSALPSIWARRRALLAERCSGVTSSEAVDERRTRQTWSSSSTTTTRRRSAST